MRKWRRMIAKNAMRAAGLRHICKKIGGSSYFSKHWREYV